MTTISLIWILSVGVFMNVAHSEDQRKTVVVVGDAVSGLGQEGSLTYLGFIVNRAIMIDKLEAVSDRIEIGLDPAASAMLERSFEIMRTQGWGKMSLSVDDIEETKNLKKWLKIQIR